MEDRILIFDVETTGLIEKKGPGVDNYYEYNNLKIYNKCRLVSCCWKLFTKKGIPIITKYFVIKPNDFLIDSNSEATKIHGITQNIANQGIDILEMFRQLNDDIENVNQLVAHNIAFDKNIIMSELHRYDKKELLEKFKDIPTYCTCRNGEMITKIKPRGWKNYKIPKLTELYIFLFKEEFNNQHNAEGDVIATSRCYFKMIE